VELEELLEQETQEMPALLEAQEMQGTQEMQDLLVPEDRQETVAAVDLADLLKMTVAGVAIHPVVVAEVMAQLEPTLAGVVAHLVTVMLQAGTVAEEETVVEEMVGEAELGRLEVAEVLEILDQMEIRAELVLVAIPEAQTQGRLAQLQIPLLPQQ
jgi:hypothetical protein